MYFFLLSFSDSVIETLLLDTIDLDSDANSKDSAYHVDIITFMDNCDVQTADFPVRAFALLFSDLCLCVCVFFLLSLFCVAEAVCSFVVKIRLFDRSRSCLKSVVSCVENLMIYIGGEESFPKVCPVLSFY